MSATMSSFETANTLSQTTNKSTSLLDKNSGCNGRRNQSFGAPPLAACYVESSKLLLLASWVIFLVPVVNETSISGTWVYACCVIAINNFNGSYLLLWRLYYRLLEVSMYDDNAIVPNKSDTEAQSSKDDSTSNQQIRLSPVVRAIPQEDFISCHYNWNVWLSIFCFQQRQAPISKLGTNSAFCSEK